MLGITIDGGSAAGDGSAGAGQGRDRRVDSGGASGACGDGGAQE
jgi:hypothetical protein